MVGMGFREGQHHARIDRLPRIHECLHDDSSLHRTRLPRPQTRRERRRVGGDDSNFSVFLLTTVRLHLPFPHGTDEPSQRFGARLVADR